MRSDVERENGDAAYQLFMLVLCAWALLLFGAEVVVPWSDSTRSILGYADNAICLLFLADFGYSLAKAENRLRYFTTWGWIDLLSSIPALDAFRIGRMARVMRILRVLRGVKSARTMAHFLGRRREESAVLASVLLTILIVVSGSIAVLQFETVAGGNIASAEDAVWWALTTMTTVGYGDRFPTSTEGRTVAVFLMAAGVGVFATVSGALASWFLSPAVEEADQDILEVKELLKRLLAEQEGRRQRVSVDPGSVLQAETDRP